MNHSSLHRFSIEIIRSAKASPLLTGLAVFYIVSVIIGAYRFYTPVPQGDMWQGYIEFYLRLMNGEYSAWWEQHNEHRPVFSRILFFLDLKYFNGLSLLLIPINLIFMVAIWCTLLLYAYRFLYKETNKNKFYYFLILLTVFAFSWKQDENITWAFQSQFWAAYLFPLLSFYFLALSARKNNSTLYFCISCLLGLISAGTMANGILALPLLAFMSFILRNKLHQSVILAFLSIAVLSLYLGNYHTPDNHQSIIANLTTSPIQSIIFFIEYLGSPIKSIVISFLLGILHLYLIITIIKQKEELLNNPFYLSATMFIAYYLATALATAGGRVDLGIKAALVGRYTTPSIISIFLCFILYLYIRPQYFKIINKRNVMIIAILMLGTQARTLIKNTEIIHDSNDLQALQLEIDAHPNAEFQAIATKARLQNISIFGIEPFIDKRELLGKKIDLNKCIQIKMKTKDIADALPGIEKNSVAILFNNPLSTHKALYVTTPDGSITTLALAARNHSQANIIKYNITENNKKILLYSCEE